MDQSLRPALVSSKSVSPRKQDGSAHEFTLRNVNTYFFTRKVGSCSRCLLHCQEVQNYVYSMQKFGWKRKIGAQVSRTASTAFEAESKTEEDAEITSGDVDWLTLAPLKKRTMIGLEDGVVKAGRLAQEGSLLAGSERYWEALKKWDEALQYSPCDGKLYEMKAQALMEVGEVYPAVKCAKKAVEFAPTWWVAQQTHGRALLGLGEVRQAIKSFSRAIHLNPGERELWEDDLQWACSLLYKKQQLDDEKLRLQREAGAKITPVVDPGHVSSDIEEVLGDREVDVYRRTEKVEGEKEEGGVKGLPTNYVQMRDPEPP